jgi:protocatechuate 3,4-dioxygenase alpha subunit
VGPFYSIGLCRTPGNVLAADGIELRGTLFDGRGEPIPDGMIEVWDAAGRRFGRCGTQPDGTFSFRVPADASHLEVHVFARGLLRHQRTRVHLGDAVAAEDPTLVALRTDDGFLFDIHMQGEQATLFFAH